MTRALPNRILALIGRGTQARLGDRAFNELALEIFEHQLAHNAPYRQFCRGRKVRQWRDIPAVPTSAFKEATLTTIPPRQRVAEFQSSGTTQHIPSRHFHSASTLAIYKSSVLEGFKPILPAIGTDFLFLTPSPRETPHSSLAHMMEAIRSQYDGDFFVRKGRVQSIPLLLRLTHPRSTNPNPCLLGTALAFAEFFDFLAKKKRRLQLKRPCWAMETGGFKGLRRELNRQEFYTQFKDRLGLGSRQIASEYGMCELSSQFYATESGARIFRGPPWTRARVIDPETGREAREGQRGLIRILDLANVGSVLAIQTEDVGVRRGEGFELLGRAPRAEARGCSLMMVD